MNKENSKYRKIDKIKLVIAGFISLGISTGILINSVGQFILPIHEDMGYSVGAVSFAFSLISAGVIFAATFVAKLIDKYNVRVCMATSTLILAIFAILISFTTEIWQFFICTAIMGLAFTGLHTLPVSVMINNVFPGKRKGLAMSLAFSGSGIGGMLFNPIFNAIISASDWRVGFLVIGGIYFVAGILITWLEKPPKRVIVEKFDHYGNHNSKPNEDQHFIELERNEEHHITEAEYLEIEAYEDYPVDPSENIRDSDLPYGEAIRTRAFVFQAIGMLILCGCGSATMMHSVPYMINIGISSGRASFLISVFLLTLAASKIVLGIICDKVGIKKGVTIGMVCYICGIGTMLLLNISPMFYILFLTVGALGISTATVTTPIMISYLFGNRDYTRIFGLNVTFNGIGNCLFPALMGRVFDMTGSYIPGWCAMVVLLIGALILYTINFRNPPKTSLDK